MVSLMSDSRVVFLLWFVSVAVIVAAVLIFVEIRLKKKREAEEALEKEETPIDRMNMSLLKDVSTKEKLGVIDRTAKTYFREEYEMSEKLSYAELAKQFKEQKKDLEFEFCKEMFEAYYSNHELTEDKIKFLGKKLEEVYRKKNIVKKLSDSPSVLDKVDRFLEEKKEKIVASIEGQVRARDEKIERKARIEAREEHELFNWVRNAIHMGYDKNKIVDLLNDGNRNKGDVKKILKVYDKESKTSEKQFNVNVMMNAGKVGVAQRIIQKEKDRLGEVEVS